MEGGGASSSCALSGIVDRNGLRMHAGEGSVSLNLIIGENTAHTCVLLS